MVRDKIRASQLVNRLEDHALGEVAMSATQVQAALGLLKKCVPDLSSTELSGNPDAPLLGGIKVELTKAADSA